MIDNRLKILYSIGKYCINIIIFIFALGAVGVTLSMVEEYRLHKMVNEMNERAKQHGKMDTNR
tara:strand:+ start:889 stop:1077 length:189 start_codon:yes stop_codon:yes gene_type:complete